MKYSINIEKNQLFLGWYTAFLLIPYIIGYFWQGYFTKIFSDNWWIIPLGCSTVLATSGPFVYLYFQKKEEDKLQDEQRQYQSILRDAAIGMGEIKELNRLLKLIVYVVAKTVGVNNCQIYLYHGESKQYVLKATRSRKLIIPENSVILESSALISALKKTKGAITKNFSGANRNKVRKIMSQHDAEIIVPSFIEDSLIALIILGKRRSGKPYTHDDLSVFSILASQSALAIENAQFIEEMKKTHKQLFQAEKMATIGTMADGLSHQINNRLHSMGFIAGDAKDTILATDTKKFSKNTRAFLKKLSFALERIEHNVSRGGEIVEGLLKYTRKGSEGFEDLNFNKLLDATFEMLKFKVNFQGISIKRLYKSDFSGIYGNFTQIQEVLFNVLDNAYDAMMQRTDELKEKDYRPRLEIAAKEKGNKIEITISDNGIGAKGEELDKIFTPFFTTKISSKKGTGLGMYVIRQIIQENHSGSVEFISKYKEGSKVKITLPRVKALVKK